MILLNTSIERVTSENLKIGLNMSTKKNKRTDVDTNMDEIIDNLKLYVLTITGDTSDSDSYNG